MSLIASVKHALSERRAKKERRAAMSFNATRGSRPGKSRVVRPESPGTGITDSGAGAGPVGGV